MSISEDNNSYAEVASFDDDAESVPSQYDNARGDRFSEESSSYHASVKADPASKNKKCVKRLNPETGKLSRVEFFPTLTIPNSAIKNAISGIYQTKTTSQNAIGSSHFRVGTADEDLFFSVILATGEAGRDVPVLFYDSPEQYEHHFYTKLSKEVKENWACKRDTALLRMRLQQQRASRNSNGGFITVK